MIVEKAYAKINLGLEVERKREDSYHDLAMVMTSISLSDELYFEVLQNDKIIIECEKMNHIKLEDNLIYKTASLIKTKFNIKKGVRIKVIKNIPEQAGLGGGSADAAATLRGLNLLFDLKLSLDDLAHMAIDIGSDVPFCVYNKTAKVKGKGEVIEFINDVPFLNIILVIPSFKSSTADVFNSFKIHYRNKGKIDSLIKAITSKDIDDISNNLFNDLEYSYFYNDITKIKDDLVKAGAKTSLMTGSGSTVFGICLNDKDALKVNNKFLQINRNCSTILTQTRSNIKYVWNGQPRQPINYEMIDRTKTKAYGYIPLVYQKLGDDYITIETPINLYNEVFIEKIKTKVCELYINGSLVENQLSKNLTTIVSSLNYGLIVKIMDGKFQELNLVSNENYLAAIINALSDFNEDIDKLLKLFTNKVRSYMDNKVVYYDSKPDEYKFLDSVPFGYILIADLGLKDYKNPKYTRQVVRGKEIINVIQGIEEKNFYKIADNLYNSLSKFETRNIETTMHININKIKNDSLKFGAQGFLLSVDGKSIICLTRSEKQINSIINMLNKFYNIRKTIYTSIKSNVVHHFSESKVFREIEKSELVKEQKIFDLSDLFKDNNIGKEDYDRYDYDDFTNPFESDDSPINAVPKKTIRNKGKKIYSTTKTFRDIEDMLHIHSGGSLFKFFDFKDIALYFNKYFNDKEIKFLIDKEVLIVRFTIDKLPHLLGFHKIDLEIKGRKGFERLISGEFSYSDLKVKLEKKVFDQIVKRAQGLVLIFNDFYHGKDDELICYEKDILSKEESKLRDKLKFGITRGVARNQFHTRNVLGIGFEENSNYNYFITSFLWDAQASLGKKEGYKVRIVKD